MTEPYRYVFIGTVLPAHQQISVAGEFQFVVPVCRGLQLSGTIGIVQSRIVITGTSDSPLPDIVTAKNIVRRLVLNLVAAIGFSRGMGLDVQIDAEIGHSHPPRLFNSNFPEVGSEGTDDEVRRFFEHISQPHTEPLRAALRDFVRAIREPDDTMMLCQRAVEVLRNTFAREPGDHETAWKELRENLAIPRQYLQPLTDRSKGPRHGQSSPVTGVERASALKTVRTVIQRYVLFLDNGKKPMDSALVSPLTDDEFTMRDASR